MLRDSGFIWSLCIFPNTLAFGNALQRQPKHLALDKKENYFSHMLKMLRNFWTHAVPRTIGTIALSCT